MIINESLSIGDKIRDIEDDDCYYEGIIIDLNPLKYKITNIVWCNETDTSMNGQTTYLKWWLLEKLKNNSWIRVNNK
jgi:hypothetical protein